MDLRLESQKTFEAPAVATHPLDPLSAAEIDAAADIIREHFEWGEDLRVETIDIDEPPKDVVRNYSPGAPIQRIARFNVYQRGVMGVWQGRVDLKAGEVISKEFRADARPMVAVEEIFLIEETVKADARIQEALRRRGLPEELEYVCVDPGTIGNFGHEIEANRRVLTCFLWMRMFPLDNYYAHPIEGLHALVDLTTLEILRVRHAADRRTRLRSGFACLAAPGIISVAQPAAEGGFAPSLLPFLRAICAAPAARLQQVRRRRHSRPKTAPCRIRTFERLPTYDTSDWIRRARPARCLPEA